MARLAASYGAARTLLWVYKDAPSGRMIVERATELKVPYQVIFTTSMMNPDLELEDYVIGPHYTPAERSLIGLS